MFAELLLGTLFPWVVALFLSLLVILSALLIPTFVRNLAKSPKKFLVLGLIALIGATYLRFGLVPNQHRIFYDEDRYLGYSVSFARLNKAVSLEVASLHQSVVGKPDQAVRVTIPVLHGIVLKLFGYHEAYLFNTSRIISILLALFLSILSFQLFRSYAGAFVTFVFALFLPIVVYWSASMALDPYFVFFTVLSFVYLHFYLRRPSHYRGVLASVAIFLLLCVRIESFILLPLMVWLTIAFRSNESQPPVQPPDIVFLVLLVPLICIRGFASISVIGAKWCCADSLPLEAFSIKYVTRNLLPNIMYVITGYEVPFVITIPAL